ncbi:hypothetical protein N9N24_03320, partial [Candidatus Marinimicrobia bacterium]|nr:hypothetical protein [Candidatus Neomarinimicrobiota bacterium]
MNKLLLIFVLFTYVLNGQKYKTNNQSLFNSKNKISTTETTNVTVPRLLSYQGLLTKTDGKAIKDGSIQVTFRLYTSLEEGVHFWEEVQNVAIEDGILTAVLGKIIPIDNVPDASFLEVEINGTTLSPRQEMTSSFYSVISDTSKYSQGGNYSDLDGLPDLTIFSSKDTLSNFTLTDSLNPIALSGDYLDLENVPDLSDVLQSDTLNLYVTKDSLNSYVLTSSLSAVATSNNYLDLNNLPNLSQYATKDTLTNFISEDTLSSYALNTELGSIVIQDTNNVNITGGSISGISDMLIADGGTGASDIATARENLGLEIGTDVQGYDADLADLADGSLSVSKVQFLENISSDVQEQINNLGLNSLTDLGVVADSSELNYVDGVTSNIQTQLNNKQELNSNLTTIVNLDKSDGNFIVSDGENWNTESGIDARASLGIGSMGTQQSDNVTISGGRVTDILDIAIADGGTGASDISSARENLGLEIGADIQGYDADLADISGLSQNDGNIIVSNGSSWTAESGTDARASLGLSVGTDVQGYDADLADLADGTLSASKVENNEYFITSPGTANQVWTSDGIGAGEWSASTNTLTGAGSTIDTEDLSISQAVVTDSNGKIAVSDVTATELNYVDGVTSNIQTQLEAKQLADSDLSDLAGLTQSDGNIIVSDGSNWTAESGSDARTSLGVSIGSDVQAYDADLTDLADGTLSASKVENNEYFITSPGTAGEVWISDGSGAGEWGLSTGITGAASTVDTEDLIGKRALISDIDGKIAISDITSQELRYLDDVSSNVQTQLDGKQSLNSNLTDLVGLSQSDGNFIVSDGANWTVESGSDARASLGLGSLSTQESSTVTITGGSISGITDIDISDGGTGASDIATARENLGLEIGTDVQGYDADLADLADGTLSASKVENNEYFITSPGTANQVWTSDGIGAGEWSTSTNTLTGAGSTIDTEDLSTSLAVVTDSNG